MKSDWIMQCLKYPKEALERQSKFSALSYCKPIKCSLWSLVVMRLTDFECMCGPIIFSHHAMKQLHWFHSNLTIQSHSSNISGTLSLYLQSTLGDQNIFILLLLQICCLELLTVESLITIFSHFFAFKCLGQLITKDYCSVVALKKYNQVSLMTLEWTVIFIWHNHWNFIVLWRVF